MPGSYFQRSNHSLFATRQPSVMGKDGPKMNFLPRAMNRTISRCEAGGLFTVMRFSSLSTRYRPQPTASTSGFRRRKSICLSIRSGKLTSSASILAIYSPPAREMARFRVNEFLMLRSLRHTRTLSSRILLTNSQEPSVEASSTITSSQLR